MGDPICCECGHGFVDVFGVYRHKQTGELKQFAYCEHCFSIIRPMMAELAEWAMTGSEEELEVAKVQIS